MGKRHEAIGIKQVVRLEWYDVTLDMLLGGMSPKQIRAELDHFIGERLQSGGFGERGEQTYVKALTQLMKCWVTPDRDIIPLRDDAIAKAHTCVKRERIVLHWAMMTAAYPFWFKVALQVGRLFNLQEIVSQGQIRNRCYEALGERSTVERSARRVIRTFVAWGVLKDSETKGCYAKADPVCIADTDLVILMIESALLATPEAKGALGLLLNNPAFFPFQLSTLTGDLISQRSDRIDVVRYGLDEELLNLKYGQS
ncbi:MAG: hypothetical protein KZQ87_15470 [Candidatus Thiodiazotropha sp. (ex Cardiolucina cf. quadrata)]|nr:hypothetical protein [Candidatus Thiodiazotropha sp. (ex Cardiolucina cf. quadrata)]